MDSPLSEAISTGGFDSFRRAGRLATFDPPIAYGIYVNETGQWYAQTADQRVAGRYYGTLTGDPKPTADAAIVSLRQQCIKRLFGTWGCRYSDPSEGLTVCDDPNFQSRRPVAEALVAAVHVHLADNKKWQGVRYEQVGVGEGIIDVLSATGPHELRGFEIKSCRQDFTSDKKWQKYLDYCHEFSFVTTYNTIEHNEVPREVGLYYLNPHWRSLGATRRKSHETRPLIEIRRPTTRTIGVDAMLGVAYSLIRKGVSCTGLTAASAKLTELLPTLGNRI